MHQAVLDNIGDAIVVVRQGMTASRNRAFAWLLGFSAAEPMGMGFFESLAEDPGARVMDYHRGRASDEEPIRLYDARLVAHDGRVANVAIKAVDVEFEGQPAELLVIQDVTRRSELEARLLQAQRMEVVGGLAGGTIHEVNNMLTAIINYSSLAGVHVGGSAANLTCQLLAFGRWHTIEPRVLSRRPRGDSRRRRDGAAGRGRAHRARGRASQALRSRGFVVFEASDGLEAARVRRRTRRIHMALIDIVMPLMTGREVARIVKKTHPEAEVLYTSAVPVRGAE